MLKIDRTNIFFSIIAIIQFVLVYVKTPYKADFSVYQGITWFLIKLITLLIMIIFWQLVPFIYTELKKNNKDLKDFLIYTLIYLTINLSILLFIWPGHTHNEYLFMYSAQKNFDILFFWHWLTNFEIAIAYNIIPSIGGVNIVNSILQSIIVGFCVLSTKKYISKKFYRLIFLPFCFPIILIQNHTPIRLIFVYWLMILVFFFIYTYQNKEVKNKLIATFAGIIIAITIALRIEYTPLIILFPIMIFSLKVFSRKNFVLFLFILFISFSSITLVQKINVKETYELHNLFFVYKEIESSNIKYENFRNDKEILEKAFPNLNDEVLFSDKELPPKRVLHQAKLTLGKMLLGNISYFIKRNINLFTTNDIFITTEALYKPAAGQSFTEDVNKDIKPFNTQLRDTIIKTFVYGTEKQSIAWIYNPYINFILLGIIFIYGLLRKKTLYFTYYTVSWLIVLFLVLLTMPWANYMYLLSFFINTWLFLTVIIAEILELKVK